MASSAPFLTPMPPMGIYETLYAFQAAFGTAMGGPGTHPWSQGFPLTTQLPDGPPLPTSVSIDSLHLRYPKAWGYPALRTRIAEYYKTHYGANIEAENVMVFGGGRPALLGILMFLQSDVGVQIASTEYTPYYDMLERLGCKYNMVDSSEANAFHPPNEDYFRPVKGCNRVLGLMSNPCNPTGITRTGAELEDFVRRASQPGAGGLVDEAYEFFHDRPVSALQYVRDINQTNLFVASACTKGLQSPGIRVGWVVASRKNIETLGNFATFGMGGVSHLSQLYAMQLLEEKRVVRAREAVIKFYDMQRDRYGKAFRALGLELFTGDGGFYHWCKLPAHVTAEQLNQVLFKEGAAILKGTDCDMFRAGDASTLRNYFRFSFGALPAEDFEGDIRMLGKALETLGVAKKGAKL